MKKVLNAVLFISLIFVGGCNSGTPNTPEDQNISTVELIFDSVNNDQKIEKIDSLDSTKIVKEQTVSGGAVVIYSRQDDNENIYGAFKTTDAMYSLEVVGGMPAQLDDELLSIKELRLFNKTIIRIKGVFGANAPVQNYFTVESGHIHPFLRIDTGHATELDPDGNGSVEIVASHGTPMETYIYKWEDEKFSVANVNQSLKAISVHLDEEKRFNAFFEEGNTSKQFAYESGLLRPLN